MKNCITPQILIISGNEKEYKEYFAVNGYDSEMLAKLNNENTNMA